MRSWIIALPRPDLEQCIKIGCFGKEKPGDRISEVEAGDGIACYANRESKIVALGKVTRGYYQDDSQKFLKEGTFAHRFDFQAELLQENEINLSTLGHLSSIPEGGNLGLLVKSGFRILTPKDWNLFCSKVGLNELINLDEAVLESGHRWWWVNQGQTYKEERKGGYIWAPQRGKDGQEFFHHLNVSKVKSGDAIFHYVDGKILSVSVAKENAEKATKPTELESSPWERKGYRVSVQYTDLDEPVQRDVIPIQLRMSLGNESKSPFNKGGTVNQGYLFALPDSFIIEILKQFPQLLPPGVEPPLVKNFNNSDPLRNFINAIKKMRVDKDKNGSPRLYKPAALLSIFAALDAADLSENKIHFDWLVPRFEQTLANFGKTGDDKQAAAAFFHLQNEPFWRLVLNGGNQPPLRGEPAQIRNHVDYASFTEPFWSVITDVNDRKVIHQTIMEHWILPQMSSMKKNVEFDYATASAQLVLDINKTGFTFEPWQIACYITALRTKPFLILAGVSGSGKSQLPQLVAEATGAKVELIPVRPDWTDSSDVLGYVQLQGQFCPGHLLKLAAESESKPNNHFVCVIDEMNLARVEHYFAEVLSRIEQSRSSEGKSGPLLSQSLASEYKHWEAVTLSSNLAIVGTVNMDESTHGFSRKVLDRAFTLEFSEIDLTNWESDFGDELIATDWPIEAWQPRATRLANLSATAVERDQINKIVDTLVRVNEILTQAQLQLAYRSRDEIALFVLHANDLLSTFVTRDGTSVSPLDLAIQMKVLPRIAGGSGAVRKLVLELLGWSWRGAIFKDDDDANPLIAEWAELRKPQYLSTAEFPRTCARLCLMWERILHEGYTSYWL